VSSLAVEIGEIGVFWRATETGHGGRRPERRRMPASLSLSSVSNSSRPLVDQRSRLEDTPSRGKLYKEPLCFHGIEPAVLSVNQEIRLLVLKTYFFPVNQKYVFWYLQFCHSNCFGRKIFVLTPI
jgi:hypothetical protein